MYTVCFLCRNGKRPLRSSVNGSCRYLLPVYLYKNGCCRSYNFSRYIKSPRPCFRLVETDKGNRKLPYTYIIRKGTLGTVVIIYGGNYTVIAYNQIRCQIKYITFPVYEFSCQVCDLGSINCKFNNSFCCVRFRYFIIERIISEP